MSLGQKVLSHLNPKNDPHYAAIALLQMDAAKYFGEKVSALGRGVTHTVVKPFTRGAIVGAGVFAVAFPETTDAVYAGVVAGEGCGFLHSLYVTHKATQLAANYQHNRKTLDDFTRINLTFNQNTHEVEE